MLKGFELTLIIDLKRLPFRTAFVQPLLDGGTVGAGSLELLQLGPKGITEDFKLGYLFQIFLLNTFVDLFLGAELILNAVRVSGFGFGFAQELFEGIDLLFKIGDLVGVLLLEPETSDLFGLETRLDFHELLAGLVGLPCLSLQSFEMAFEE